MIERSRVRVPAGAAGEFSSPGSTFCADSYFGTPSVTAVARKRSRSFCQNCRCQVTGEQEAPYVWWLDMVHGCRQDARKEALERKHRTCAETAAVSCGTSHVSTVCTPLRWIFKNAL